MSDFNLAPTKIILQLANKSVKSPVGTTKYVLIKVNKFPFLVEFIEMEIKEDYDIPLILGRPFMKTSQQLGMC